MMSYVYLMWLLLAMLILEEIQSQLKKNWKSLLNYLDQVCCSYDIYCRSYVVNLAICDPVCVHGACVSNNTCSCSDGYEGELCDTLGNIDHQYMILISFIVYEQCEENFCNNGATCEIVAGDYICLCAYSFSGPFCNISKNISTFFVSIKVTSFFL